MGAVAIAGDGYTVYPNTRNLCSEHVSGNSMHITWATYATRDTLAKVVAHYENQFGRSVKGDKGEHSWGGGGSNHSLSVYPATQNDAFPSCATKPARGETTVIRISTAAR